MSEHGTIDVSVNKCPLECFVCGDKSLCHGSEAYWNKEMDDLLCGKCHRKRMSSNSSTGSSGMVYVRVATSH